MLRSDAEIALDEALLAAAEAGRIHREAASTSQQFRAALNEAASLRDGIARELATAARSVGWLPAAPDPDLEATRTLTDEVRLTVEAEKDAPLAEERHSADQDAVKKLTRLMEMTELPAPVAEVASSALKRLGKRAPEQNQAT
jgi:hypothetical protein